MRRVYLVIAVVLFIVVVGVAANSCLDSIVAEKELRYLALDLAAYASANDLHMPPDWATFIKWLGANGRMGRWNVQHLEADFYLKWGVDIKTASGPFLLVKKAKYKAYEDAANKYFGR